MDIGPVGAAALSITGIAAVLLIIGGIKLAGRADDRRRGILMIVAGLVAAANVLIWTWPAP